MSSPAKSHGDWVLWFQERAGGAPLYVPPEFARQREAEQRKRELMRLAEEEADIAERRRARDAARTAEAAQPYGAAKARVGIGQHRPHQNEVGRHLVLRDVDNLVERVSKLQAGLYGEKDHITREVQALSAALERGPERSVVRPPDWRDALADLANEMPAFRSAVAVLANALALAEATLSPPAIPPLLLVGPPGTGKSHFARRLSDVLGSGSTWLSMDQPTAGCTLRGTDAHWSTARHGVVYELLALGETANPVIVIDEIDKASRRLGHQDIDMLSQLYASLEPETARHLKDVSLDVELDASLVVYVATANQLQTLDDALLSRFHVVQIGLPSPDERRESAYRVVQSALTKMGVLGVVRVSPGCVALLEQYSPRVITRAVERAVGAAAAAGRDRLGAEDFEVALGLAPEPQRRESRMH